MFFTGQRISLFDLEKKLLPGLDNIENIIESKIKYIDDISNHVDLLKEFRNVFFNDNKINLEVFCGTKCSAIELKEYLKELKILHFEIVELEYKFFYKIIFKEERSYNICLGSSTIEYKFYGSPTVAPQNRIDNINKNTFPCTDVPINYDKLIIGPVGDTSIEELITVLNSVDKVISLRNTTVSNYYTFTFLDSDMCKSFIEVLTKKGNTFPTVRYCYQDCILLDFNKITGIGYNLPIPCSLITTKIVLLSNVKDEIDVTELIKIRCKNIGDYKIVYYDPFNKFNLPFKLGLTRIFIECKEIETAELIYYSLGGCEIKDSILCTSFFPEYNFYAGEFE